MSQQSDLKRAAELLKADKKAAARELLVEFLKRQPNSDVGWYLLSFAVLNPDKQRQCLQRTLAINPDMKHARQRLQLLAAGAPKKRPEASRLGPEPARRVRPVRAEAAGSGVTRSEAVGSGVTRSEAAGRGLSTEVKLGLVVGGIVFVLAGVGGAYAFLRAMSGTLLERQAAENTAQAATSIARQTAGAAVALPPTWTPTPQPEPTATPTFTPTPTPTPTASPIPPDPTTASDMEQIESQVANLRGLPRGGAPAAYLINSVQVRPYLEASFREAGGTEAEINDMARVLTVLGLVDPEYDLYTNVLNSLTDSLGGFYIPWSDEIFVIGNRFSGVERWVYSHEYTHALVDHHHGIDGAGVYPLCKRSQDSCRAIEALVEGDATLLMTQWLEEYASPQDTLDILNYTPPTRTLPDDSPPPYTVPDITFPYVQGLAFVDFFHSRGGWSEIDRMYADLPLSTEQILHPEKYLSGEAPRQVGELEEAAVFGEGWRRLEVNTLGEWTTFLVLAYGASEASQVEAVLAEQAAAGWGGDRYSAYHHEADDGLALVARWIWDTPGDAQEFARALRSVQDGRFQGVAIESDRGDCWQGAGEVSCVLTAGQETLWLLTPDLEMMSKLQAQYGQFG